MSTEAEDLEKWDTYCRQTWERHQAQEQIRHQQGDIAVAAPWWVAISNTSCERRTAQGLQDRGFEVWWPTRRLDVRVGRSRVRSEREFPLFPGYLFVRHADTNAWPGMAGVDGLKVILCVDTQPLTVSAAEVDRVKAEAARLGDMVAFDPMAMGTEVRLMDGPFLGFRGLVERLLPENRVQVALSLFGRPTGLQIEREKLDVV